MEWKRSGARQTARQADDFQGFGASSKPLLALFLCSDGLFFACDMYPTLLNAFYETNVATAHSLPDGMGLCPSVYPDETPREMVERIVPLAA